MWFGWKGLQCSGARLIYLSSRWQVLRLNRSRWSCWRVREIGTWGISAGRLDVVKLP